MKRFGSLVIALLLVLPQMAQDRGRAGGAPKIGVLTGRVIDAQSPDALEFVSVALYSKRDSSLVTGGTTERNGYFQITEIPLGMYYVEIMFMGFEKYVVNEVILSPKTSTEADLGTIRLQPAQNQLNEVEVSERADYYTMSIDRKTYKVEELPLTEGGTTADVFQQIPSVEVDMDGNISLRGSSNVTILVDGKPSTMVSGDPLAFLESFPADAIERIEVITNPGAKYNPEGMSGIINIVTKKNKLQGFGGSVNSSIGTYDKYSLGGQINYKNGKWSLSSSYSFNHRFFFMNGESERISEINDQTTIFDQEFDGNRIRRSHFIKLGADYALNPHNTFTVSGSFNLRPGSGRNTNEYVFMDENMNLLSYNTRDGRSMDDRYNYEVNAGYIWQKGQDHQLNVDLRYSEGAENSEQNFEDLYYNNASELLDSLTNDQWNDQDESDRLGNVRIDYTRPLGERDKMEAGFNYDLRQSNSDLKSYNKTATDLDYILDTTVSNQFIYTEQFYAVYGNYMMERGKWSTQVGARLEQAYTKSDQRTLDTIFELKYFNIFPSAYLKYAFSEKSELKASYSRRISRPRGWNVNPFTRITDPYNIRTGNPYLRPEYTDAYELEHALYFNKGMFSSSIYYRYTTQMITRIRVVDTTGVSYSTYANLDNGHSYGFEFILNHRTTKNLTNNVSFNLYRQTFQGDNLSSYFSNEGLGYNARLMSTYKVGTDWSLQGSVNYNGPRPTAQGKIGAMYNIDLAIKKDLWDRKASLSVRVSDIFWTRQFVFDMTGENFVEESMRRFNSRNVYLSFNYRFGNYQPKRSRRSNSDDSGPSDSDPSDMM